MKTLRACKALKNTLLITGALLVLGVGGAGCGRLGLTTPSVSPDASTTHASSSSDTADGLAVGVKFRIDPYLVAESDANSGTLALAPAKKPGILQRIKQFFLEDILKQKPPSLALTAGSVALDGIDHAIVNVLGCTAKRYIRESELHQPNELPFVFHNFEVKVESGINNDLCYISLDILQIAFDYNTGTTITETYLRDAVSEQSAGNRDGGGQLVFVNRTSPASMVGPQKLYVSVSVAAWDDGADATSSSAITYTLKSFSVISNDRDLSTISAASAVITGQNSITIGQSVDMPLNLLSLSSLIRPTSSVDGYYYYDLWCTTALSSGKCGDVDETVNTAVCAIPEGVFSATDLGTQCPSGGAAAGSPTSATKVQIAAFGATNRVSENTNGVLSKSDPNLDDFVNNPIPIDNASQGFFFVVRTDTTTGIGFKYWHIINVSALSEGVSLPFGAGGGSAQLQSSSGGSTVVSDTLNLLEGVSSASGGNITVAGTPIPLNDFTSGSLVNEDLSGPIAIGDVDVTVAQAVQLTSSSGSEITMTGSSAPAASVSIPSGTTVLASAGWDGTIAPPSDGSALSTPTPPPGFSVGSTTVALGSGSSPLIFDTPVTITLTGVTVTDEVAFTPQVGSSTWTVISTVCAGTFASPTAPLFAGECRIDNGVDTIKIVTWHFTIYSTMVSTAFSLNSLALADSASQASRYTVTGSHPNAVVYDNYTGLYWEQTPSEALDTNLTGDPGATGYWFGEVFFAHYSTFVPVAEPHCTTWLNASGQQKGGYSDWRLPTRAELQTLVDYTTSPGATIDTTAFSGAGSASENGFWTKSLMGGITGAVFIVDFSSGFGGLVLPVSVNYGYIKRIRCVRSAAEPTAIDTHNFVHNGNYTVSDSSTNLMWEAAPHPSFGYNFSGNYAGAQSYCTNLVLAGYSDWRTATIKEISGLHNISSGSPPFTYSQFSGAYITDGGDYPYWSSTPFQGSSASHAWALHFGWGVSAVKGSVFNYDFVDNGAHTRCVRTLP
jgi:hypothetical protein